MLCIKTQTIYYVMNSLLIGLLVVAVIALLLLCYCNYFNSTPFSSSHSSHTSHEGFQTEEEDYENQLHQHQQQPQQPHEMAQQALTTEGVVPRPSAGLGNNEVAEEIHGGGGKPVSNTSAEVPADCFPKDQLSPQELVPSDAHSTWAQVNPCGQGSLNDNSLLNAGQHVGINTVGQSLRNANLQLRSEPPNPQVKVSPWMQTTIEPDTNRRAMEIGCD